MRTIFLALALTVAFFHATSQPVVPQKALESITSGELSTHVHTLASPGFEGRYTGTEGLKKAANYIREEFGANGLLSFRGKGEQQYFQSFSLEKCFWADQQIVSGSDYYTPLEDFLFLTDPQDISGEFDVVFSGFGLDDEAYSDYGGIDVNGKIVMAFSGEPRGQDGNYFISGESRPSRKSYYFSKMRSARDKGARGILIVSRKKKDFKKYTHGYSDYRDRAEISYPGSAAPDTFFAIFMNEEAAARMLDIRKGALLKTIESTEKTHRTEAGRYQGKVAINASHACFPINTENVVGYIEGTDLKEEAVVVVAHYDHLGQRGGKTYFGADDNASGTSAVMEIAEAFAEAQKEGYRPLRSVIFLAVAGEEIGLFGSRFYTENPEVSLENTYACVNIDMIGRAEGKSKDNPDYIGGMAYVSEDILQIARSSAEKAAPGLEFRMTYRERVSGGSDHYYFARNNIPSLFYFSGIHKDYHEPTDTPDKLLYDRMEGTVRSIFLTVWELANKGEKLRIEN